MRTGFTAVTGPGVRITVDDAPGGDVTQVVRDSDLAILVIGNPQTLAANLLDSTHGQEWYALKDSLGFQYQIEQADSLSLPAARLRRLRSVRELIDDADLTRPGQDASDGAVAP